MTSKGKTYDLTSDKDVQELMELFVTLESDAEEIIKGEESDDESDAPAEERQDNSETEQSDSSDFEGEVENVPHFIGFQKNKNKVINEWKWRKSPFSQKKRTPSHNIVVHLPGVKGEAKKINDVYGSWNLLISDNILNNIVQYTNQYIESVQEHYNRIRDAKITDIVEIKAFIGLLYLAGIYHANRLNLEELWSPDGVERFRKTMSLRRFYFLIRCLRFDDRITRNERMKIDRLAPIRNFFEEFVSNCQTLYSLGENVVIDEKLEAFRGRCKFKQYIPSKPAKYGIKIFALVDAKLFYTYNMEIYAGQQPEGPYATSNSSADIVKRLASPIYNSGRNITMDNWFTSYNLMTELKQKKISVVGTLKKNKPQIPTEFKNTKQRKAPSSIFGFQKDCTLVSYTPRKNKNVILLSSLHSGNDIDQTTGDKQKPEIITFYNSTKGGVDTVDKMCASYNVARNSKRWPMVVFFSILNVSAINSMILFVGNKHELKSRRSYLRCLARQLTEPHIQRRLVNNPQPNKDAVYEIQNDNDINSNNENKEPNITQSENVTGKRKRCSTCYTLAKRSRLSKNYCIKCKKCICVEHYLVICANCLPN